jgi:hypothetical protein
MAGRPKVDINIDDFVKLCEMQCTRKEIAGFFDCEEGALDRWIKETFGATYMVVFERFRSAGLLSLRRSQFQMSEKNVAMAIWLGKQYLGQKDIMTFNNLDDTEEDALTKSIKASMGTTGKDHVSPAKTSQNLPEQEQTSPISAQTDDPEEK